MLVIDDVSLRVAGRLLIERSTAQIPSGARVGLVGRNGTGKSSLFRAIAGDIALEHGRFVWPSRASIGRLPQEAPDGPEPLIDIVLAADRERSALLAEAETATDPHRIAEIQSRLADIGAHAAPARAAGILAGLGFSQTTSSAPARNSPAAGACASPSPPCCSPSRTFCSSTSPPTISTSKASCGSRTPRALSAHLVVISHDRDLLNNAVDLILHLEHGKLTFYRGNYTSFERQRRERSRSTSALRQATGGRAQAAHAFVDRFRAKATRRARPRAA